MPAAPSIPDSHRFLLDTDFGTLATIGADGRPQLSEVWFLADHDTVKISLNTVRQKTKNLMANPAVSFLILDLDVPHRYLELRGDASIEDDSDYAFAEQINAKYDVDLRDMDTPGELRVVVTIVPTKVHAVDLTRS